MMKLRNEQRGLTFFGLLIVLGLIGFFALVALKMIPLYLDYQAVSGALNSLESDPRSGEKGKSAIIKRVRNQLDIEGVTSFRVKQLIIKKDTKAKAWKVGVDYEAKANLFGNIYVMVHFQKEASARY